MPRARPELFVVQMAWREFDLKLAKLLLSKTGK